VAENSSAILQNLIDRLRGGDLEARRELLQRSYNRLLRIAAVVVHEDFPAHRLFDCTIMGFLPGGDHPDARAKSETGQPPGVVRDRTPRKLAGWIRRGDLT
jgi:hypothetical protein